MLGKVLDSWSKTIGEGRTWREVVVRGPMPNELQDNDQNFGLGQKLVILKTYNSTFAVAKVLSDG